MSHPKALGPDFELDAKGNICHAPSQFDPNDDDLMHDVVAVERLIKPVQELCILAEQIQVTQDSYGVSAERLAQSVIPKLAALLKACREEHAED